MQAKAGPSAAKELRLKPMLISIASGMRQRHAKLAIYNVPSLVQEAFASVSLSDIIPIGSDENDARRLVST